MGRNRNAVLLFEADGQHRGVFISSKDAGLRILKGRAEWVACNDPGGRRAIQLVSKARPPRPCSVLSSPASLTARDSERAAGCFGKLSAYHSDRINGYLHRH
jgi:hypothetical protein